MVVFISGPSVILSEPEEGGFEIPGTACLVQVKLTLSILS